MTTKYQEGTTEGSNDSIKKSQPKQNETFSNQLQNSSSDWTKRQIGAFWMMDNKWDEKYLSGNIVIDGKNIPIHIYKNRYHEGNRPEFIAYLKND